MKNSTLNIRGNLFIIESPVTMGILNVTPDSFYQKSAYLDCEQLLKKSEQMIEAGAFILDIGGISTRPGAKLLGETEEWERIAAPLKAIRKHFPDILLSVDTFRATIAKKAADEGIDIINDISAGTMDKTMFATVAALKLPYIAMHMQGTPQNMQQNPYYENVTREVLDYFIQRIEKMETAGIKDIIIDPGFGFGKTIAHNYQLLKELGLLSILEKPVLAGISRKSMIYKLLKSKPEEALNATTALNMLALQNGADILRVHDVKEAMECIQLYRYMKAIN